QQLNPEIGLVLVFLDEVTIAPREDTPIEITRIIAGRVLPILGELHRESVIGAAVHSTPKPLNHRARAQLQAANRHQRLRVDELRRSEGGSSDSGGHGAVASG